MEKSSAVEIYFETSARCACTFPTFNLAFNLNFLSSRKLRLKARLKVRAETLRLRPKAAVGLRLIRWGLRLNLPLNLRLNLRLFETGQGKEDEDEDKDPVSQNQD